MSIVTYPLDGILYSAADAELYNSTRTSGVYALEENLDFSITGAREITISPGMAWIKNDEFAGKAVAVKDPVVVQFDEPNSVLDRIDRIVLRFSLAENGSSVVISKGAEASTPVAPARATSPDLYELVLYDVSIPHGMVELSESNVVDQRANPELCGLMTDGVSGMDEYLSEGELEARFPWSINEGGTGGTTILEVLHNLGILAGGINLLPTATVAQYGFVQDFAWYTGTSMTTAEFMQGMPINTTIVCMCSLNADSSQPLVDSPAMYTTMMLVKGANNNYRNGIAWSANTANPKFWVYSSNGSGTANWAKLMTSADFTLTNGVLNITTT